MTHMHPVHISEGVFGKVDQVPGVFYVGTVFLWMKPFPLFPVGGAIVVEKGILSRDDEVILKAPLSLKSVMFAYLRIVIMMLNVLAFIGGFAESTEEERFMRENRTTIPLLERNSLRWGLCFVLTFPALYLSYGVTKAGHTKARQIAAAIGISQRLVDDRFRRREPREPPKPSAPAASLKEDVYRLE